jgi:hypothetical protein
MEKSVSYSKSKIIFATISIFPRHSALVALDCPLWPHRMGFNPFHARAANRTRKPFVGERAGIPEYDQGSGNGHSDDDDVKSRFDDGTSQ